MTDVHAQPVWSADTAVALPGLPGPLRCDACVIGLGGSGLSAVRALCEAGVDTIGIDAVGVASGAAGGNGGFLLAGQAEFYHDAVARFGRQRALALYRLTVEGLRQLYAAGVPGVRQTGSLRLAADAAERADCTRQLDAMYRDGLAAQLYEGPEGVGVLVPEDGAFDPAERWNHLAALVQRRGARLYGRTPALSVETGRVVTPAGVIVADRILIAVDGGLEHLLTRLAGEVRSVRLQMLATAPAADVVLQRPVYYRDGLDYWQQLPDGRVALGGARDIGGDAEWTETTGTSAPVQAHLERLLRTKIGTQATITHRWSARVAFSRTGLPLFGRVQPGVFVTGAYCGTGNVLGALCGEALVQLALGRPSALASLLCHSDGSPMTA
ncbi:NAD(P)/FAD-dependent oxidoreductase [Tahibacter amnicola]|uniref:FAD-binding oxidoreductase n=1 Tax=Tahibacter amnicola TaxID=2976241 RepID=A0ABY6BJG3_9GAMM|nr:FAD-binding oxidoreductase [Tahibacter amnicola]UXI69902.1 FAD-binding oxidoreductase [Tahibacter amnicola]